MANNFDDDFSYDSGDPELDENGLPIEDNSSLESLMDMIMRARDENNEDNNQLQNEDTRDTDNNTSRSDENESNEDNEPQFEDARDIELKSAGEKQGPKTLVDKIEDSFLSTKLGKSEAKMKALLTQLENTASTQNPLILTPTQQSVLTDSKSLAADPKCKVLHPIKTRNLKRLIKKVNKHVRRLKIAYWTDKLAPILPYVAGGLLIVLAIILLFLIIAGIAGFISGKTNPANMSNNSCVTSEYFYGTRSVYIDEEALINSLQLSYKQYIVDIVNNFEETNPSIDITITLPTLEEGSTLTNDMVIDQNINNLSLGIANIVATGSSNYSGIQFTTLYPQIEYFGLTAEQGELTKEFISNYINDNSLYSAEDGTDILSLLNTTITDDADLQYIYNRCEKVMIKDEIANANGLSNIKQRQYIASIYMPNKDIVVDSSIYSIASESETFTATSKLIEENNGSQTIHNEKETTGKSSIVNGFIIGNVRVSKFTSIDENNISAFSEGLSLFAALRLSPDYINYFALNAETNVYTWKPTATSYLYFTFDASSNFIFTDFSLNVKNP